MLRALGALPELAELGVDVDPANVDWLWRPAGALQLLEGSGKGISAGLLVRATETRTTGYTVVADLNDAELRANAIARADLHFLSASDSTRSGCVGRVFDEYELHELRPWQYRTRHWLRSAALVSNPPVVGVGRRLQSAQSLL